MDAQDFRSLQEAYMDVYSIDEKFIPPTRKLADKMVKQSVRHHRHAQDLGGDITPAGIKKRKQATKVSHAAGEMSDRLKMGEELNIYDIILSHLLDEGYAETPESAEAIMVNMSEEWREDIVEEVLDEGYVDWKKGSLTVPSRVKGNKRTESPYERAGRSQFRKYADAQTTRGTQAVRGPRGRKARLAAKQQEVIQQVTQKYNEKDKG